MKIVARSLVPAISDIDAGPPVARIIPFTAAIMCAGIVASYFFGLPTVSSLTIPMFALPIFLFASKKAHWVTTGYAVLAIGCAGRAVAAFFAHNLLAGQVISGLFGWGWMAYNFALCARMVQARGIRQ